MPMSAAEFERDIEGGRIRITTWGCLLLLLTWTALLVVAAVCWKIVALAWAWAVA